jgi:hypothetical protein
MFLSSDHTETPTTPIYQIPNSASYGVIQLISVNRAGSVPPVAADALSGAAIVATNSLTLDNLCNLLWQGVTITLGGAGGNITFGNSNYKTHYFRNCAFVFTTSTTNAFLGTNNPTKVTFDNTTVSFNNAGQHFAPSSYPFDFLWINTPAAIPGTVPTILFNSSTNLMGTFTCRGVDFSAVNTTLCYGSGGSNATKALFDSCRINSAVVRLGTAAYANSSDEIELVNCYDGTNFLAERHTPAGDVTTEFTITLTGGAQDNVGTFSHKMISSARSDMYAMPLEGFWMDVNNTLIGSARTATVEIISSASLNNNDITLLLEYEGTSGSSLASFVSSLASPLTATAAVPTSTATWNSSPATPVKQHLQVTFTPLVAGRVRGLVRLGKVSTTVYVNPVITIT